MGVVASAVGAEVGVGAKPVEGGEVIFDGSREMLDDKWIYWEGPRFASALPIKWKIVEDPVDNPLFPFPDRLRSVFSALGEKANS